jgi:CheY-like chemotaxis protein
MTKVLVVEDENLIRESILEILNTRGFTAIGAEDGPRGLQLAKEFVPDLILCDIRMPGLDGYEVLTALRQDPLTANIPLIFITAETIQTVVSKGEGLGANGYLNKPFTTAKLLEAINLEQGDR